MKNRITTTMKSIDIFGDSINFSAKGGARNFKTWVGALFTFLLCILLISYSVKRFVIMINRDDTKFGVSTAVNVQDFEDEALLLEDLDVQLGFRLV